MKIIINFCLLLGAGISVLASPLDMELVVRLEKEGRYEEVLELCQKAEESAATPTSPRSRQAAARRSTSPAARPSPLSPNASSAAARSTGRKSLPASTNGFAHKAFSFLLTIADPSG